MYVRILNKPEIFKDCSATIPLLLLQNLDLYAIPNLKPLNEQNRMCELCTFSQIRLHI